MHRVVTSESAASSPSSSPDDVERVVSLRRRCPPRHQRRPRRQRRRPSPPHRRRRLAASSAPASSWRPRGHRGPQPSASRDRVVDCGVSSPAASASAPVVRARRHRRRVGDVAFAARVAGSSAFAPRRAVCRRASTSSAAASVDARRRAAGDVGVGAATGRAQSVRAEGRGVVLLGSHVAAVHRAGSGSVSGCPAGDCSAVRSRRVPRHCGCGLGLGRVACRSRHRSVRLRRPGFGAGSDGRAIRGRGSAQHHVRAAESRLDDVVRGCSWRRRDADRPVVIEGDLGRANDGRACLGRCGRPGGRDDMRRPDRDLGRRLHGRVGGRVDRRIRGGPRRRRAGVAARTVRLRGTAAVGPNSPDWRGESRTMTRSTAAGRPGRCRCRRATTRPVSPTDQLRVRSDVPRLTRTRISVGRRAEERARRFR